MSGIERFVRYSTRCATLTEAWEFVMAHIDQVGGDPGVQIQPTYDYVGPHEPGETMTVVPESDRPTTWFDASVYGVSTLPASVDVG